MRSFLTSFKPGNTGAIMPLTIIAFLALLLSFATTRISGRQCIQCETDDYVKRMLVAETAPDIRMLSKADSSKAI